LSDHLFDAHEGQTSLTAEEREGLVPSHVTLRRELNELEQQNILEADVWAFTRKRDIFAEPFGRGLHRRMFAKVWRWAGRYRESDKNIGIAHWQIPARLPEVLADAHYWVEHTTFPPDEVAVRLHHALVFIHPFANGNGRWSRLMADLLAVRLGQARFSWGRADLRDSGTMRRDYIEALRLADAHDLAPLIAFARS
jgi:Fic-DOC domain mobile mystery protein B